MWKCTTLWKRKIKSTKRVSIFRKITALKKKKKSCIMKLLSSDEKRKKEKEETIKDL